MPTATATETLTAETITPDQILALEHEAGAAGDAEMVATCRLAIYGATLELREGAIAECVEAINNARAMIDT